MDITYRTGELSDWDAFFKVNARNFGEEPNEADNTYLKDKTAPEDLRIAEADTPFGRQIVGNLLHFPLPLTMPGGEVVEATGVTYMTVSPTHRRRGIMKTMFTGQLEELRGRGTVFAALTATDARLYRRFGYGRCVVKEKISVDLERIALAGDTVTSVAYVPADQLRTVLPPLYEKWRAATPAAVFRGDADSHEWVADLALGGKKDKGDPEVYYLAHPDGFASYQVFETDDDAEIRVRDFFAATPQAEADLWRTLCGVDAADRLTAVVSPDYSLPYLVDDHRQIDRKWIAEGMWVRILDVARALESRPYAVPGELELTVTDSLFGDRTVRLAVDGQGRGTVSEGGAAGGAAALTLDVSTLSMIFFGAHDPLALWRAGDMTGTLEAARTLALMFTTDRAPAAGFSF